MSVFVSVPNVRYPSNLPPKRGTKLVCVGGAAQKEPAFNTRLFFALTRGTDAL